MKLLPLVFSMLVLLMCAVGAILIVGGYQDQYESFFNGSSSDPSGTVDHTVELVNVTSTTVISVFTYLPYIMLALFVIVMLLIIRAIIS